MPGTASVPMHRGGFFIPRRMTEGWEKDYRIFKEKTQLKIFDISVKITFGI